MVNNGSVLALDQPLINIRERRKLTFEIFENDANKVRTLPLFTVEDSGKNSKCPDLGLTAKKQKEEEN